jgi:hypothetical protein
MFISKKKMIPILAVIISIIITIAGFSLVYSSYLSITEGTQSIQLTESDVPAGIPTALHFSTTEDKGTIYFPEGIMPAVDGIFRNITTYNFTRSSPVVQILIPPTITSFSIEVVTKSAKASFDLTVNSASDTLVSGESYYNHEATMVRRFNNRDVGTIQMKRAADYYNNYFQSLGLESEIRKYQRTSGYRTYNVLDVIGYKWGVEHPDEWIILGGHYDIAQRSIEGAFDNGGGACAAVELAKGISQITTSRTVVFGLWDGEEQGLWGSNFFAKEIPPHVNVKAYLNFDMVGLNWPLQYKLLALIGPNENDEEIDHPDLVNIANDAVTKYLGYPLDGIEIRESSGGGSDHLSFQNIGVQTYFFYADAPYIQYHRRTDLLADMVAYAGGRDNLEKGFATVAWIALYITILIDNNETLHQLTLEER